MQQGVSSRVAAGNLFRTHSLKDVANVLQEKSREEVNKGAELRAFIGEHYRELLESADVTLAITREAAELKKGIDTLASNWNIQSFTGKTPSRDTQETLKLRQQYAIALKFKVIIETNSMVQSELRAWNCLGAALLYLNSQKEFLLLQSNPDPQVVSMLASCPLVAQQWSVCSNLPQKVIDRACQLLSRRCLTSDAYCNGLAALFLLSNSTPVCLFQELLDAQLRNLTSVAPGSVAMEGTTVLNSIASSICCTLTTAYSVFMCSPGQPLPLLVTTLQSAAVPSRDPHSSDTPSLLQVVNNTSAASDITFIATLAKTPGSPGLMERETLRNVVTLWSAQCSVKCQPQITAVLERINTPAELASIATQLHTHISTLQKPNTFSKLDIWALLFETPFVERAKVVSNKSLSQLAAFSSMLDSLLSSEESQISGSSLWCNIAIGSPKKSPQPLYQGLNGNTPTTPVNWRIRDRAAFVSPGVSSVIQFVENCLRTCTEETKALISSFLPYDAASSVGHVLIKEHPLVSHVRRQCCDSLSSICSQMMSKIESLRPSAVKSDSRSLSEILIIGRFAHTIIESCGMIKTALTPQGYQKNSMKLNPLAGHCDLHNEATEHFIHVYTTAHFIWAEILSSRASEMVKNSLNAENWGDSQRVNSWEAISLNSPSSGSEERPDEQIVPIDTKVYLPRIPSPYLSGLLYFLCQQTNNAVGHSMCQTLGQLCLKTITSSLSHTFGEFIQTKQASFNKEGRIQLWLDLLCLFSFLSSRALLSSPKDDPYYKSVTLLNGTQWEDTVTREIQQKGDLIASITADLDPVDIAFYDSRIKALSTTHRARCGSLFGSVLQYCSQPAPSDLLTNTKATEAYNPLGILPPVSRFTYVKAAAPLLDTWPAIPTATPPSISPGSPRPDGVEGITTTSGSYSATTAAATFLPLPPPPATSPVLAQSLPVQTPLRRSTSTTPMPLSPAQTPPLPSSTPPPTLSSSYSTGTATPARPATGFMGRLSSFLGTQTSNQT
ncbi:conserved oligomeric Golgi complex subunit 1 [Pelomyxa schiedti]|nr:conserved oligomeric Golgi complex subunit 1 [Pelomyxa schiedti]